MNNVQNPDTCKHEPCSCPRPDAGGDYCSAQCESAANSGLTEKCQCGHPGCA